MSLSASEYADRRQACEDAAAALALPSLRDATSDRVAGLADATQRIRVHHVVSEIARVRDVVAVLDAGRPEDIGVYLTASHESLRDDFEVSCAELDVAVGAALSAGALGARMTGAASEGAPSPCVRAEDVEAVTDRVQASYARQGGTRPTSWRSSRAEAPTASAETRPSPAAAFVTEHLLSRESGAQTAQAPDKACPDGPAGQGPASAGGSPPDLR